MHVINSMTRQVFKANGIAVCDCFCFGQAGGKDDHEEAPLDPRGRQNSCDAASALVSKSAEANTRSEHEENNTEGFTPARLPAGRANAGIYRHHSRRLRIELWKHRLR